MSNIAEKLKILMAAKSWTETDLAKAAGLAQPTVHRIISGESQSPRLSNLAACAKAFNVSVSYLTSKDEENSNNKLSASAQALINKIESTPSKKLKDEDYILLMSLIDRLSK